MVIAILNVPARAIFTRERNFLGKNLLCAGFAGAAATCYAETVLQCLKVGNTQSNRLTDLAVGNSVAYTNVHGLVLNVIAMGIILTYIRICVKCVQRLCDLALPLT